MTAKTVKKKKKMKKRQERVKNRVKRKKEPEKRRKDFFLIYPFFLIYSVRFFKCLNK